MTLTITASHSMSLTMGCIGTGMLTASGPLSGAVLCHDASLSRGAFDGYYRAQMPVRTGKRINLRVVARAKTIWDIRVDGLPRHCKNGACTDCSQYVGECSSQP